MLLLFFYFPLRILFRHLSIIVQISSSSSSERILSLLSRAILDPSDPTVELLCEADSDCTRSQKFENVNGSILLWPASPAEKSEELLSMLRREEFLNLLRPVISSCVSYLDRHF